jgi:hypothetical protein
MNSKHYIKLSEGKWYQYDHDKHKGGKDSNILVAGKKCFQDSNKELISMEMISQSPRVFVIKDFLSNFEADMIVQMGIASKSMLSSTVSKKDVFGSSTRSLGRTSTNTWLDMDSNEIIRSIFKRAAELLRVDPSKMNEYENAEFLQLVHYDEGQKYDSHFDWTIGMPHSRFITLLLYLSDKKHDNAGGETSFPAAKSFENKELGVSRLCKNSEYGIKIHPGYYPRQ